MSIEAMKQWLAALESIQWLEQDAQWARKIHKSVESLRQAIEQAEKQEPVHQWQQKHSPYWYDGYPDNDDGGGPYETRTLYTTPQPQREWVGLTLDEIDLLEELYAPPVHPDFVSDASHCLELIRHVEYKLKEKNT